MSPFFGSCQLPLHRPKDLTRPWIQIFPVLPHHHSIIPFDHFCTSNLLARHSSAHSPLIISYRATSHCLLKNINMRARELACRDASFEQQIQLCEGPTSWLWYSEVRVDDAKEADACPEETFNTKSVDQHESERRATDLRNCPSSTLQGSVRVSTYLQFVTKGRLTSM